MHKALDGIVVVEQAGRLAASVCGALLGELGATVVRVERPDENNAFAALALPGKRRLRVDPGSRSADAAWRSLAERADVFVLSPGQDSACVRAALTARRNAVVCTISAYGAAASAQSNAVPDWAIQAESGVMAVTGDQGGPPLATNAPVLDMFTGINAATAILAALRTARLTGVGQSIDMTLFASAFALLGTHLPSVVAGRPRGHRVGCGHPLCAPWDAYRSGENLVQICTASEAQWQRFAGLIGRQDLLGDARFASSGARVTNASALNAIVQDWLTSIDPSIAVSRLLDIGIPAAKVEHMENALANARARGDIATVAIDDRPHMRMRSVLRLSATPGVTPHAVEAATDDIATLLAALPPKTETPPSTVPTLPLEGLRIVEIGPYTAGPLAGRYLLQLGAEIIKIEPPGGEDSRRFQPQFGGVSGFFSNYNWGKQTIELNLIEVRDRERLGQLLETADIVLHNLKAGALERLGIDLRMISLRRSGLISCAISGYGAGGAARPALDTVIQAQSGIMSLIGDGGMMKSGFSLGDLITAHVAPLAILSAVHARDSSRKGQELDICMLDCLMWILQPAWDPNWSAELQPVVLRAADGYVAAAISPASGVNTSQPVRDATELPRSELVARLRAAGMEAHAILELDEVIAHPCASADKLFSLLPVAPGVVTPVLASPFRLNGTEPQIGSSITSWHEQSLVAEPDSVQAAKGPKI